MQSDCSLHSLSLPDQPRDIKLSKRPLDSIVTNEGPSKRSYVASSSKQPPESRVFPAVDSFVQRLANDSIRSKQIDNLSSSDKWISILGEEFNNVATDLESYLSCSDDLQQIRSTLRYTASYPSTFVHILLLPLLPDLTHEHVNPSITNDTLSYILCVLPVCSTRRTTLQFRVNRSVISLADNRTTSRLSASTERPRQYQEGKKAT